MVSLKRLKSKNIDDFKILCDKRFSNETYDKKFFEIYQNSNFIPKILIKKTVKLIDYNGKFIGYIWADIYSNKSARILSMYIDENYSDVISKNLLESYDNLFLQYETINLDNINTSLSRLGFYISKSSFLMELDCNSYNKHVEIKNIHSNLFNNYTLVKNFKSNIKVSFKKFDRTTDIKLRCDMQNSIFESDERTPINTNDIEADIEQDYFIEDFSIFIMVNDNCAGYGQIIFNRDIYTIVNLGIKSEFRGYNLSKLLLNHLIHLAKKKKIRSLYLRVDNHNYPALSLYKWANFKYKFNINNWER